MSWSYTGNTELTVSIDVNRIATIAIPDIDWNGSEAITFIATDPGLLSDSDPATFAVTGVNDAPVISDIDNDEDLEIIAAGPEGIYAIDLLSTKVSGDLWQTYLGDNQRTGFKKGKGFQIRLLLRVHHLRQSILMIMFPILIILILI